MKAARLSDRRLPGRASNCVVAFARFRTQRAWDRPGVRPNTCPPPVAVAFSKHTWHANHRLTDTPTRQPMPGEQSDLQGGGFERRRGA